MKKKPTKEVTTPSEVTPNEQTPVSGTTVNVTKEPALNDYIDISEEAVDDGNSLPSQGLGDTIKKITDLFGFKTCDACEKRRIAFNKKYRYLNPKRDLTDEEVEVLNKVTKAKRAVGNEANILYDAYNEVFAVKLDRCNCSGQFRGVLEALNLWNDENQSR